VTARPQLEWEIIEERQNQGITLILAHQDKVKSIDPWRVTVRNGTDFEIEDYPAEEAARAEFNQLCAQIGLDTEPVMVEPETVDEIYAYWWTKLYQTKQKMPAQELVEIEFSADPKVRDNAGGLLVLSADKKGWVDLIMRSCLRAILAQVKQQEIQQVKGLAGFGRFA